MKPFTREVIDDKLHAARVWREVPWPRSASLIVDDSVVVRRLLDRRCSRRPRPRGRGRRRQRRGSPWRRSRSSSPTSSRSTSRCRRWTASRRSREIRKRLPARCRSSCSARSPSAARRRRSRRSSARRDRLRHQAGQRRQRHRGDGRASATQLDPQDQGARRRPSTVTPARPPRADRSRRRRRARTRARRPRGPVDVVAIGVSTGGPNALATVLAALPADLARAGRDRAAHAADLHPPARRAARRPARHHGRARPCDGDVLEPGRRADRARRLPHGRFERTRRPACVAARPGPPGNSCRPAVDVLFRSVADGATAATCSAVVLTGMGQDGR